MLYTLKSNELTVTLSDKGAEIVSVKRGDCEYVWQGNPEFWSGQAPILFPICGRLFEGKYTYRGQTYEMNLHGFARRSVFAAEQIGEDTLRFTLAANEETKKQYPFDFELTVDYTLLGSKLSSSITVNNTGKETLPAALGLHPGFNVPLEGGSFEDWYLEFASNCSPDELILSDTCFMTGKKKAFGVENGKIIRLRHELFNVDAIFMSNADRTVTLKSDKSPRSVTFSYPDMPYLGLWHKPKSAAPYVCIEPWCGLPAYDGVIDDFEEKCDMFRLIPKDSKTVSYELIFG